METFDSTKSDFWFKHAASGEDVKSDLILGYMWAAADSRDHNDVLLVMEFLESKIAEESAKTARILAACCIASEYKIATAILNFFIFRPMHARFFKENFARSLL